MKVKQSSKKFLRATLVLSLFISVFQNINIAHADGNGLQWFWRTDSGATTGSTYSQGQLTEFNATVQNYCSSQTGGNGSVNGSIAGGIAWGWGSGGPANCTSDGFTTYGLGYLYAPWTGQYTLCSQSDDGFWLRIDGTDLIKNWVEQGAQTGQGCNDTKIISLNKGQVYSIRTFHHENGGGADMRLLWKYDAMTSYELIPTKFFSTVGNFAANISISTYIPYYGRGNTTYTFGAGTTQTQCDTNQRTLCTYTINTNSSFTPLTYSAVGTWPSILRVNSTNGSIEYNSGGTFVAGTYTLLKVRATDFYGVTYDSNSFSIYVTEPLNPAFGTYTRTANGFTVQITNYDPAFSWAGTATAGGSVSISGSGLVTVSGVASGTNSIATITTTRDGYDGGTAVTASTQSLQAQSITWSPLTSVLVQQSPLTPSTTATVLDGASVSYSITNAGSTGCTINSSSAVLSFIQPGTCVARASAAATSNYASATKDVTFTVGSISANPVSDTTTAGLTTSFSFTTIDTPSATTRSIKWQVASDTVTAAASVSWSDVASGSGYTTTTFTTGTLTSAMNKYRYRAIVTFVSARGTSVETTTIATLTVNPSISITSTQTTITKKYGVAGVTRTITFTGGTDTKTVSASSTSLASGKITFDNSTAKLSIDTGTAVGTYYDTITVADAKGATATYTQVITATVADSLTVQADTLTAMTYSPNGMSINPTSTITGLVSSDIQSAITYTYTSSTLATCAQGGSCNLGDTGPGGGTIFYDAGSTQSWGRYIEASPIDWYTVAKGGNGTENVTWCSNTNYFITGLVDAIGYGLANKQTMAASCDLASGYKNTAPGMLWVTNGGAPGGYNGGGKTDWFLPSLSEMDALNNYSGGSLLPQKYYWIAENTNATISPTPAYSCCSQSWPYRAIGGATKSSAYPIRPMRYVTPDLSLTSYNSTTPPTSAGTYTITPSALILANSVSTSNYSSIVYKFSQFTINKAVQDSLTITSKLGPYNGGTSTLSLTTTGGSDTGTVTYSIVSGGSASGCSVSTNVLSFTSAGTCKVVATKAATLNYLVTFSDTVTITLSQFVSNQPVQTQQYPNQIPINGKNSLDTTTVTIPDVTSVTSTGAGTYTIVGTGFTGVSRVVIGGTEVTISSSNATSINISGAAGLIGPLIIECSDGRMGPVPFWLIL